MVIHENVPRYIYKSFDIDLYVGESTVCIYIEAFILFKYKISYAKALKRRMQCPQLNTMWP